MTKKYSTQEIKQMIVAEAQKQGVPIELALAVAKHESGFNNLAKSKQNTDGSRDHGVFQLNDKYHKLKNVYDPNENIAYGIKHLKGLLAGAKGNIRKALSDYNAGANATGKGRKQGDAYAQKVMALMKNDNINGQVTGAAAPVPQAGQDIGNVVSDIYQSGVKEGEDIYDKYIKNIGYDTKTYEKVRKQKQAEIEKVLKELSNLKTTATPEQVADITNRFTQAKDDMQNFYNTAIQGVQSGMGADRIDDYYNKLAQADKQRLEEMKAANPYTRLGQEAPINLDDYEKAAIMTNLGARNQQAINSLRGLPSTPPDFQAEQMRIAQAQQAAEMARRTGLTPEQFLAGAQADYNNMGTVYNNQQQALANLIQAAYNGDRQAQQILANMQTALGTNIGNMATQEQQAIRQADADALARAQFTAENARFGVQQGQNLDAYPLSADAAIQQAKINQVAPVIGGGANRGANMTRNVLSYEGMLQRADAASQPEVQDPYKAVKDYYTFVGNMMGMSPNTRPEDLQRLQEEARGSFSMANPAAAQILYPNMPQPNYTQFQPINTSTFQDRPRQ